MGLRFRKEDPVKVSRTSLRNATGALALAALLSLPCAAASANDGGFGASVTDLRVGVHPDHTRIVIETDGKAPFVVDPSDREVLVHVDAAASAEAVTTRSPHLVWVKVEPTALGTDVRIQLKQPVEVKALVLTRPDRIVLDLYPKAGAAEPLPQPLPTPELLPEEEPPAPVVAEAPQASHEPEAQPAPEEEPGLPEEHEQPLVLELPKAEPEEHAAPAEEGAPAEAGQETAAAPAAPGEGSAVAPAQPAKPAETARKPAAPTTPAAPAPSGSRFGSPFALGATAMVLLVLFVWLRRRLRASERPRIPIPAEEAPSPFEPPARAVAVGEEAASGESVFDVEPESLATAREEVPTLRPPVGTGLDAEDEAERRIAHLEKRIEELAEAKDRLERQIAAQTEELRVQRAAIARTQRVLRSIAPKGDEEPSEPLVRG
jgi:hypothetical protein